MQNIKELELIYKQTHKQKFDEYPLRIKWGLSTIMKYFFAAQKRFMIIMNLWLSLVSKSQILSLDNDTEMLNMLE